MRKSLMIVLTLGALAPAMSAAGANAQQFQANLSGFNEDPSIFSQGQGTLKLNLNTTAQSLTYTLTYSGLSTPVTQAHIQFAKARDIGGVIAFLCGTAVAPGPPGTPTCPAPSGTVTGTITPASIFGPAPQGITAGDFAALTAALLSESTYANVHTENFPAGEIRGQIHQNQQGNQN